MKFKKSASKSQKSSKKNRKGAAEEICLCCYLEDKIERVLVDRHERQPIAAERLLYLIMSDEPNVPVSFDLFDGALICLEGEGVIENDGGRIKLATRSNQSQSRLVN